MKIVCRRRNAVPTAKLVKKLTLVLAALALPLCLTQSASAFIYSWTVNMSGPNESPANASPGIGSGLVSYDNILHTLTVGCSFSGLTGTTTASHIHAATLVPFAGTAGVATTTPTFAGFPLGATSGTYTNTLDLTLSSSWNSAYITANGGSTATAEVALFNAMQAGEAYWNIHSSTFGGGEIRGFLVAVLEPTALSLVGLAAVALVAARRKSR